jgi:hypothetical protein
MSATADKENERRVVYATPLQKRPRVIRRVNNTVGPFGVSASLHLPDSVVFIPLAGAPQSCLDFKNSRSLCPKGVLKQFPESSLPNP